MKKLLGIICIIALLFSCYAMAEDMLPEIAFNDIPLGATVAEIEAATGESFSLSNAAPVFFYTTKGITAHGWGAEMSNDEPYANKLILTTNLNNIENVAGYDVRLAMMLFVRPIVDGTIVTDNSQSVFYAGFYEINAQNKEDNVKTDLSAKLTTLYGEAVEEEGFLIWYGANNTAILMKEINGTIGLTYAYLEGDAMYQAGQDLLSAPVDNSNNTSGL